jgi:hypothetical protein
MNHIKINKVILIGLLIILLTKPGQGTPPAIPLQDDLEREMYIAGIYPKVGEVFEVIYRVRLKEKNQLDVFPAKMVEMGYVTYFRTGSIDPVTLITEKEIFVPVLNKGEWHEFSAKYIINEKAKHIKLIAGTRFKVSKSGTFSQMTLHLIDPETGQYGTEDEYLGKLPVEYRYDPVDGSFTCSPNQNPAPVSENRRIIQMIKNLEPRISDSLALLLHSDQYRVGCPAGLPRWDEENKHWIDGEIFEYYLRDGWFDAVQEGRRDTWIIKERKKIMVYGKEHKFSFVFLLIVIALLLIILIVIFRNIKAKQ